MQGSHNFSLWFLWAELCPPLSYVEFFILSTSECELIQE